MARYVLPDLRYDYGALEPHISGKIMELHHDKHHRTYVKGANDTLAALEKARSQDDFERIAALEHALAFNVSGHVLHSIFWQNLSPHGGGEPDGELAAAIERDFGSYHAFRSQLVKASSTIMGSGWGALAWDPVSRRLITTQLHDHQSETTPGGIPLLVLDAWEHAYYLQYGPDKAKYLEAIWNVVNWKDVAKRFATAQKVDLALTEVAETTEEAPVVQH